MLISLSSASSTWSLRFGKSLSSDGIKCTSSKNQTSQASPMLADINSNEPLYCLFTVTVNTCGVIFTTIDDWYAGICVVNKVKNRNMEEFNLISRINETKFLVQHGSCECKWKLTENIYNSK